MTPEQRQATPPWGTQDVPDEQQIVTSPSSSGVQMSTKTPPYPGDVPMQGSSVSGNPSAPAEASRLLRSNDVGAGRLAQNRGISGLAQNSSVTANDPSYPGDMQPSARAAAYGLPTKGYHGTVKDFGDFQNNPGDYMLDRGLGTHFAKDPEVSNSFVMDRVNGRDVGPKEGGRVIQAYLPDEKDMLTVDQPPYEWAKGRTDIPPGRGVLSDQTAIERMIAMEAYRKDPSILARYLTQARRVPEAQAGQMAADLAAGKSIKMPLEGDELFDMPRFIDNYGGKPYNDADRKRITQLARKSWMDQGYKGLKYVNTSPMEMATAKDPTSYIVFDPANIRSSSANFDPAKKASTDFMHARGGKVSR